MLTEDSDCVYVCIHTDTHIYMHTVDGNATWIYVCLLVTYRARKFNTELDDFI